MDKYIYQEVWWHDKENTGNNIIRTKGKVFQDFSSLFNSQKGSNFKVITSLSEFKTPLSGMGRDSSCIWSRDLASRVFSAAGDAAAGAEDSEVAATTAQTATATSRRETVVARRVLVFDFLWPIGIITWHSSVELMFCAVVIIENAEKVIVHVVPWIVFLLHWTIRQSKVFCFLSGKVVCGFKVCKQ